MALKGPRRSPAESPHSISEDPEPRGAGTQGLSLASCRAKKTQIQPFRSQVLCSSLCTKWQMLFVCVFLRTFKRSLSYFLLIWIIYSFCWSLSPLLSAFFSFEAKLSQSIPLKIGALYKKIQVKNLASINILKNNVHHFHSCRNAKHRAAAPASCSDHTRGGSRWLASPCALGACLHSSTSLVSLLVETGDLKKQTNISQKGGGHLEA